MIEVPKRTSLVDQVAEILRRGLRAGEWAEGMPPERVLCDRLQVSRPTLRAALDMLRREGVVRLAANRRKWMPVRRKRTLPSAGQKLIAFLSPGPPHALDTSNLFALDELRRHLHDAGFRLEFVTDPRLKGEAPLRVLEGLVHQVGADCWILHWARTQVQRWFRDQRLRVIVKGTCYEGITLPSIDLHYRALARHAVGIFFRMGHRRILLLRPERGRGDLAQEEGFLDAFEATRRAGAVPLVLRHDGTPANVRCGLRAFMSSRTPPTAILISHAIQVLTVMTDLMNSGLRVPKDVALISSHHELFLDQVTPTVACYQIDWSVLATRLSRMAVRLASTGVLDCRPVLIMPEFRPGDSLGPLA